MSSSAISASSSALLPASSEGSPSSSSYSPRYIDIGINLADPIFRGQYNGRKCHEDDLEAVVQRAHDVGCLKLIATGSSFRTARDALRLAEQFPGTVFATAGIHPCSSAIFERAPRGDRDADDCASDGEDSAQEHTPVCDPDPANPHIEGGVVNQAKSDEIIAELHRLAQTAPSKSLVAFGEIGLDYARLHYCSASTQRHAFAAQLKLAARLADDGRPLPLFLHSRDCHEDFVRLLKDQYGPRLEALPRGAVVHSFTGSITEAEELMELGLYLGVNGCSLRSKENCSVVKAIRLDRLLMESDGPWCEVRPTHEGWSYLVNAAEAARNKAELAEEAALAEAAEEARAAGTLPDGAESTSNGHQPRLSRKSLQNRDGGASAKNKKKPAVPARFISVKKDKWQKGAMVKGRNEPCNIEYIATIVAGIKGITVEEVCEAAWANTVKLFGPLE
ncbi:hypothetical protein SEPCBS119000_002035 [Sporothrix epigloea]|uniref:TatD DNase family protein n=1 Tax=Sporothrix epigloea TaxID=1892477 RepID=A0ABP0DE02_9PEZI